jgi:hypothetical protein
LSQEPKISCLFFHFLSKQTIKAIPINIYILKLKYKNGEEESNGPPRVRQGMLKLECKQEREGEEQTMGHESLKRQGHSPPAHHPPLDQHSQKKQEIAGNVPTRTPDQRTKENPLLGLSRERHGIRPTEEQ